MLSLSAGRQDTLCSLCHYRPLYFTIQGLWKSADLPIRVTENVHAEKYHSRVILSRQKNTATVLIAFQKRLLSQN